MNDKSKEDIFEYITQLNKKVAHELIKTFHEQLEKDDNTNIEQNRSLIFPRYSNKKLRVSEQELRFEFIKTHCREACQNNFNYSVETPTKVKFDTKTGKKMSARIDFTLFNKGKRSLNIEFKANNPDKKSFEWGFKKIEEESSHTNWAWIHLLRNENKRTIKSVFEKIRSSIKNLNHDKINIYYSFIILGTRTLLIYDPSVNGGNKTNFDLDFEEYNKIEKGKKENYKGWEVERF